MRPSSITPMSRLTAALLLALLAFPLSAVTGTGSGTASGTDRSVVFHDDFSGEATAVRLDQHVPTIAGSGWTQIYTNNASYWLNVHPSGEAGANRSANNVRTKYRADPMPAGDEYDVEITVSRIHVGTGTRPLNVILRWDSYGTWVNLSLYRPDIGGAGSVRINRRLNEAPIQAIVGGNFGPAPGDVFRAEVRNDGITVFRNGVQILFTDNVFHTTIKKNAVGLSAGIEGHLHADWRVSDFKVTELIASQPPAAPVADFSADATAGTAPFTVAYSDHSLNGPTSWAWDFDGDGIIDSTLQHPTFTYPSPGTYPVSLSVSNASGSDTETKLDYITVSEPPT